jgi:DNA ligase (NAD+)
VRRAGDVIPEVVGRAGRRPAYVPNFHMPALPGLRQRGVRERGGIEYRCTGGLFCPAQRKQALLHFAGRRAMDIEGLGDKLVEQLVDAGIVLSLPGLYKLGVAKLAALDRMAEKSAQTSSTRWRPARHHAGRFLFAGHPPGRRDHRQDLARHFGTLDALMNASVEQLLEVPDVGPIVAASIHTFFAQPHNREVVEQLLAAGVQPQESVGWRTTARARCWARPWC